MQVEAFAIRLRQRGPQEAADLGVRLCQHSLRAVFKCYAVVALPVMAFALASIEIAPGWPILALWWSKPWLDRTIMFVLARAAFGQDTSLRDLWREQRQVWWSQLIRTWTVRRLSPWRSFTQPVYQLEGLRGSKLRRRVLQIRTGKSGQALLLTGACILAQLAIIGSLLSLAVWFAPSGMAPELSSFFAGELSTELQFSIALAYAVSMLAIEPFYVAAGFGMYLSRRVELEAWDIEQEFRRADFARAVN